MAAPRTGKVTYPYQRWGATPENPEMRQIVKLRASILAFENAAKELKESAAQAQSAEVAATIRHIQIQMDNCIAYAKHAFNRIETLGEAVYERGKMGRANASRRAYFPGRDPT